MSIKDTPIVQRYAKGDVIVSEGIISNNAYVVLSGKVQVSKKVEKKTVVINVLKEGDVFGEMGLVSKALRSANVSAMEDVTIGVIDRDTFENLLKNLPEDVQGIMKALVDRLRFTTEQLTKIGIQLDKAKKALQFVSINPVNKK